MVNLSGSLNGQIEEMLEGSVAGNIKLLSGKGNLIDLSVNANGTYEPSGDVDGYKKVIVEVPEPVLDDITITENGTYTPPSGIDGYNEINVAVPSIDLQEITITENGVYTPPEGKAYNRITVDTQGHIVNSNGSDLIISTSSDYATANLTSPLVVGNTYLISVKKGNSTAYKFVEFTGGTVTVNFSNISNLEVKLTETTIRADYYSGDYVQILASVSGDWSFMNDFIY